MKLQIPFFVRRIIHSMKSVIRKPKDLTPMSFLSNFDSPKEPRPRRSLKEVLQSKFRTRQKGGEYIFAVALFIVGATGLTITPATVIATVVVMVAYAAISFGLSMLLTWATGGFKKPHSPDIMDQGRTVNTRSPSEPIRLVYGVTKTGGNAVYMRPASVTYPAVEASLNRHMDVVTVMSEGEIGGYAPSQDVSPIFHPQPGSRCPNDLTIDPRYIFSGASNTRYWVEIDGAGVAYSASGDTFKWCEGNAPNATAFCATNVPCSSCVGTAFPLSSAGSNYNIHIQFDVASGHNFTSKWFFYAGPGLFLSEKHHHFYEDWAAGPLGNPVLSGNDLLLYSTLHNGASNQTVDANLMSASSNSWTDTLRNSAYIYNQYKYNDYAWNSLPSTVGVLSGIKLLDTRDLTAAKAVSTNPALIWFDMMTNARYGLGIASGSIALDSVNDTANWCDTSVVMSSSGLTATKQYEFNGAFTVREAFLDSIDDLLQNFRGYVTYSEGKYKLKYFTYDTPVMSLTEDDFTMDDDVSINIPGIQETPTKVRCGFINKYKNYTSDFADWPEGSILPDDEERLLEIALIGTDTMQQAKRLAKFYYNRSQYNTTFSILAHRRCIVLEPGDMIYLTSTFLGYTNKVCRVLSMGIPQEGMIIPITLQEEDSSIYDQDITIQAQKVYGQRGSDVYIQYPGNLSVGATGPDEGTPNNPSDAYQILSWDHVGYGSDYELQWKRVSEAIWQTQKVDNPGDFETGVDLTLSKLPGATVYNWRVRSILPKYTTSDYASGSDFTTWSPAAGPVIDSIIMQGESVW